MITLDEEALIIAGDWHGNIQYALEAILKAHSLGVKRIIHTGDFGFWPKGEAGWLFVLAVSLLLEELDMELWAVDGNHENFTALYMIPVSSDGRRRVSKRVYHLPRGFRWKVQDKEWLALGGAASVDKFRRTLDVSWWPEELITDEDVVNCVNGGPADVMVTHDSPYSSPRTFIKNFTPNSWPEEALEESALNQQLVENVLCLTGAKVLFHGHHHERYECNYLLEGVERKVIGLDCDGGELQENLVMVGPDGRPLSGFALRN